MAMFITDYEHKTFLSVTSSSQQMDEPEIFISGCLESSQGSGNQDREYFTIVIMASAMGVRIFMFVGLVVMVQTLTLDQDAISNQWVSGQMVLARIGQVPCLRKRIAVCGEE
ncbi:hypothetical protein MSG28_008858 [Choristoneura fumiferana]|uniref:Uncharacterized protein n=1 Tax=Choristoneura fumiferana TaxID=7141 RepID=A0ACC0J8C4_CHOFU|nr:hypothetical protein MSG28_008858 [Choristoneura fumiferana]